MPGPTDPHFSSNWRSPTKSTAIQHVKTFQRSNNTAKDEVTEVDRLVRERQELVQSGAYTQDDLLIRELDRQIDITK